MPVLTMIYDSFTKSKMSRLSLHRLIVFVFVLPLSFCCLFLCLCSYICPLSPIFDRAFLSLHTGSCTSFITCHIFKDFFNSWPLPLEYYIQGYASILVCLHTSMLVYYYASILVYWYTSCYWSTTYRRECGRVATEDE